MLELLNKTISVNLSRGTPEAPEKDLSWSKWGFWLVSFWLSCLLCLCLSATVHTQYNPHAAFSTVHPECPLPLMHPGFLQCQLFAAAGAHSVVPDGLRAYTRPTQHQVARPAARQAVLLSLHSCPLCPECPGRLRYPAAIEHRYECSSGVQRQLLLSVWAIPYMLVPSLI